MFLPASVCRFSVEITMAMLGGLIPFLRGAAGESVYIAFSTCGVDRYDTKCDRSHISATDILLGTWWKEVSVL